jgi:WD40 repeat protein
MPATILFLSANPEGTRPLGIEQEHRDIGDELVRARPADAFALQSAPAARVADVRRGLAKHRPVVVHFAGHGVARSGATGENRDLDEADGSATDQARTVRGELLFLDEDTSRPASVSIEALAGVFAREGGSVRCAVLNACNTIVQAEALRPHVDAVVGTTAPVGDQVAIAFSRGFYAKLGGGGTLGEAFAAGRGEAAQVSEAGAAVYALRGRAGAEAIRLVDLRDAPFKVPFARNPHFVGRADDLERLHAMLQERGAAGVRPAMLSGLGGIGKTQLAVEYAHAHRGHYRDGVYWINAAGEDWRPAVAAAAEWVGVEVGDVAESLRQSRLIAALEAYLQSRPRALVVFDNVDVPADLETDRRAGFVPVNLGCRVLFTTRRRDVDGRFGSIEVSVLPEEAALELLLSAPGRRELWERRGEAEAGREIAAGRGICRAFGGLPLALTLAAAFLGKRPRISLGDYLERVVERGAISSTDENRIPATDLATRHGAAVAATFRSQWDTVETEEARLVLRVAALLGEAAEISPARLSLLTGLEAKGKKGFAAPLEEALGELVGLSLVENLGAKGAIRLHPLVREFVKRGTPWPGAFGYVCAKRLGDALWDMGRLHEEITGRGVDVVLGDLRIGERLAGPAGAAHTVSLRTVLEREAHSLRRWETDEEPAFLLQQIGNRGFEMDLDGVRERAHRALAAKRWPYLCERVRTSRESEALVRTVEGHTHVNDVAVTPDGRLAVFASSGMVLQVFDLVTGQAIRTLEGHMHSVLGVAMTPDGRLVVSASADGTLKVWDLATGRAVCTLEGHTDMVRSVAVTQDGRFAVSASDDKRLKVWDLASGQTVCTLEGHASSVLGVALTPDGRFAVSASWDHTLKMWDLASGQAIRTFEEHADPVAGVVVTPDGRFAVSASYGRMLKVWDLATGRAVSTLEGHSDVVAGVAVTPDGRFAVSASWDKTLKVWNLASGQAVRTLEGHAHHVTGVAVTPDGRFAVSASDDKTLKVWDLVFRQVVRTLEEDVAAACSVATTPDGRFAVSASYDRMLKVWDLASGQVIRTLKGNSCVAVTPDGRFVLSFDDRSLIAWNLDSG